MLPTKFQVNWHFGSGEEEKIDFLDGDSGHLGNPIRRILVIFNLLATPVFPNKFQDNWPFSSGDEAENRFSRQRPLRPSWSSDRNGFI